MSTPRLEGGWLVVPCDASDRSHVHIAVGKKEPGRWMPAFRDWDAEGNRVAKIRPPAAGSMTVWVNIDGHVKKYGRQISL